MKNEVKSNNMSERVFKYEVYNPYNHDILIYISIKN